MGAFLGAVIAVMAVVAVSVVFTGGKLGNNAQAPSARVTAVAK